MAEISGVQNQRRRAIASQLLTFVGSIGELAADMTNFRLSVADGVTAGGWLSARAQFVSVSAAYTVKPSDVVVCCTFATTTLVTLPSLASYPPGQRLTIMDSGKSGGLGTLEVGTASTTEHMIGSANFGGTGIPPSTLINVFQNSTGGAIVLIPISTLNVWIIGI